MNITAMKAALNNKETVAKLRAAIHNTSKLGFSVDHVSNRKGKNFLAVRIRDGALWVLDSRGKDVTQLIVKACREINKARQESKIYAGDTFYYGESLLYAKFQIISNDNEKRYLCENVLDSEHIEVLKHSTIIKLMGK